MRIRQRALGKRHPIGTRSKDKAESRGTGTGEHWLKENWMQVESHTFGDQFRKFRGEGHQVVADGQRGAVVNAVLVRAYIYTYIRIRIRIYICMHACMYEYMNVCIYTYYYNYI